MEFNLLCSKGNRQGLIKSFSSQFEAAGAVKVVDLEEVGKESVDGVFVGDEAFESANWSELERFFPVRRASEFLFASTEEEFTQMSFSNGVKLYKQINSNWVLSNNLKTLEEIFAIQTHFLKLLVTDRSGFFEELWFLLKKNLGARELVIFYNDLVKGQTPHEKNKLVRVKVTGKTTPSLQSPDEADEFLIKNYELNFGKVFEVTEFHPERGELVMVATIKKSPILIMAKVTDFTRLQNSLVNALVKGIAE